MGILPSEMNADICVIGAGASGITAALAAYWRDPSLKIVLVEEKERIGQKILVTGNGRCNLSNRTLTLDSYNEGAVRYEPVFRKSMADEVLFARLGLMLYEDESGRFYPYSNQASSVLNAFLNELNRTDIEVRAGSGVTRLEPGKQGIMIGFGNGEALLARRAILATGSPASVKSNRSEELVRQVGDRFIPFVPALVPLRIRGEQFRSLKGIRLKAAVALQKNGKTIRLESGEVQFGDGYLGGICVMDLSRYVDDGDYQLSLDLIPDRAKQGIISFLDASCSRSSNAAALLNGILPRRVGELLMRSMFPDAFSMSAGSLTEEDIGMVADLLKRWIIPVSSRCPMSQAQVCRGGVDGLDGETLSSARDPRVFYCGEIINVDGRCGGFNLHWAWISGKAAGEAAALSAREGIYE